MSKATTSEHNAISMLKKDHQKVKELFDEFEEADSPSAKARIITEAIQELKIHATIEEEIFYPAVRGKVEDDLMNEAEVEHHVARMLIAELDESADETEVRNAKFKVLAESVRHHIKEEEGQMFPQVRDRDIDLADLAERMTERKQELMDDGVPADKEHEMVSKGDGVGEKTPRERTTVGGKATGSRKQTSEKVPTSRRSQE